MSALDEIRIPLGPCCFLWCIAFSLGMIVGVAMVLV